MKFKGSHNRKLIISWQTLSIQYCDQVWCPIYTLKQIKITQCSTQSSLTPSRTNTIIPERLNIVSKPLRFKKIKLYYLRQSILLFIQCEILTSHPYRTSQQHNRMQHTFSIEKRAFLQAENLSSVYLSCNFHLRSYLYPA